MLSGKTISAKDTFNVVFDFKTRCLIRQHTVVLLPKLARSVPIIPKKLSRLTAHWGLQLKHMFTHDLCPKYDVTFKFVILSYYALLCHINGMMGLLLAELNCIFHHAGEECAMSLTGFANYQEYLRFISA